MSDNNNREYRNSEGKKVLRVTEIIKILHKESLLFWANHLGFKRVSYKEELARTANVGTAVHDTIDKIVQKQIIRYAAWQYKIFQGKCVDEYDNCMASFHRWLYNNNWIVDNHVFSDITLVGDTFGGTLDYVGKSFRDISKYIIVDFKTSKQFTLSMFLQLAAYIILFEYHYPNKILDGCMILRLDKKSSRKAEELFYSREDMQVFIELFYHLVDITLMVKQLEETHPNLK